MILDIDQNSEDDFDFSYPVLNSAPSQIMKYHLGTKNMIKPIFLIAATGHAGHNQVEKYQPRCLVQSFCVALYTGSRVYLRAVR